MVFTYYGNTINAADFLDFLNETITENYDDLVRDRGKMYVDLDKFKSFFEEANSEQVEEFKSMSRVFIVSFLLQFLLLTNSTKAQLPEEEGGKKKKKLTS